MSSTIIIQCLEWKEYQVSSAARLIVVQGHIYHATYRECLMMEKLVAGKGQVVSLDWLEDALQIAATQRINARNNIRVHIAGLRRYDVRVRNWSREGYQLRSRTANTKEL